jgi:hypothetical protein
MELSGLAVAPAPAPCAMHDAWRPRSRSRWVLGLRLLLLCPVFCLLNSLPPAYVFVFCLLRHSLPPARVLCLVRFPGPPHGKKMRPRAFPTDCCPYMVYGSSTSQWRLPYVISTPDAVGGPFYIISCARRIISSYIFFREFSSISPQRGE